MLADWFETPKGSYVLAWERGQFDAAVEDVFGFNAVQLELPGLDFLRESRIPLKVRAGLDPGCGLRSEPVQQAARDPARGRARADARGQHRHLRV